MSIPKLSVTITLFNTDGTPLIGEDVNIIPSKYMSTNGSPVLSLINAIPTLVTSDNDGNVIFDVLSPSEITNRYYTLKINDKTYILKFSKADNIYNFYL